MSDTKPEPWNPFYVLLLLVSLAFVVTALALAIVPVLEQKATQAGNPPPPSAFRDALREDGWTWLVYEGAAIVVLGLLSMGYDRLRRENPKPPIPVSESTSPSGAT